MYMDSTSSIVKARFNTIRKGQRQTSLLLTMAAAPTSFEPPSHPLNVVLLGAGIFASNAHAPVLEKYPETFRCVAVWSRRLEKAEKVATRLDAQAFTDLDKVLALPDVDAVVMALPIDVQPSIVLKALAAGKHVLSEKPIAPTVHEAQSLLHFYATHHADNLVWSVAENFRYEPALLHAAKIIRDGIIGRPFLVNLNQRSPFTPNDQYLKTPWRSQPSWYGGLFVDAFLHTSAMLRILLGEDVMQVSMRTASNAEHIPSVDTMTGHMSWKSGVHGSLAVTYASTTMKMELEIVGSEGSLLLSRKTNGPGYRLCIHRNNEDVQELDFGFGGIEQEFLHFAAACQQRGADINTPQEALGDLTFVEACLESGKADGHIPYQSGYQ